MAMLDTLRASRQLQEAGFEAPKADAIVTAFAPREVSSRPGREDISERLATKDDLEQLRIATRDDLAREIAAVRGDLAQTEERLRGEMREIEHRVVNRIYLAAGAAATFLTAVIGLATTVIVALG